MTKKYSMKGGENMKYAITVCIEVTAENAEQAVEKVKKLTKPSIAAIVEKIEKIGL